MAYSADLSKEEQKALAKMKVDKALLRVNRDVASVFTNEKLSDFLSFSVKFHYFDINNVLLLYKQYPEATFVASFKTWQKLLKEFRGGDSGRSVFATSQKGRGIGILVPYILKKKLNAAAKQGRGAETTVVSYLDYHIVFVFDRTQTNNIPSPVIPWNLKESRESSELVFRAFEANAPFLICFEDSDAESNYQISPKIESGYEKPTLTFKFSDRGKYYELCNLIIKHYVLLSIPDIKKQFPANEFQKIAECVAFMLSAYFGLPTDDYSFFFAVEWGNRTAGEMIELLSVIQNAAHLLIEDLEEEIEYLRVLYGGGDVEDIDGIFDIVSDYDF